VEGSKRVGSCAEVSGRPERGWKGSGRGQGGLEEVRKAMGEGGRGGEGLEK